MGLDKQTSKESKRRRKMEELLAFDRFAAEQGGTYTAQMVCAFLKLSLQGVDYAARTGGLKYVCFGRNRFYGKKSVQNYRWSLSRKFKDNPRIPFSPGQVHQPWLSQITPPEHYEKPRMDTDGSVSGRSASAPGFVSGDVGHQVFDSDHTQKHSVR